MSTTSCVVGGSSRIPAVRRAVEDLMGRPAAQGVSPEEVVACGAAVEAAILAGAVRDVALVDVTPLGLGIETEGGRMVTLVERNTTLPTRASALFTTVADNQTRATIRVLQGERPLAADNIALGEFSLEGLSGGPRGAPDISVSFEIDVEGIVHVSARDTRTGASKGISLAGVNRLEPERVRAITDEARASELEDIISVENDG